MNKFLLWISVLAAFSGSSIHAQNITGNWQGTLQQGQQQIRIVFKIALENDKLKSTLYRVDQSSQPVASSITRDGSTIKMAIPALNGNYEGKLSGDGNSIAGTWSQSASLPLNLTRATPETAWTIPEPPPPPVKMTADADPAFEVATIKPSNPSAQGMGISWRGSEMILTNTTLHDLIVLGYLVHPKQIVGAPAWITSEKFDVTGKSDTPGQPNQEQIKIMERKLLADRFQFKFHLEKRELAAYTITIDKAGSKLIQSQDDPKALGGIGLGRTSSGSRFTFRNMTIADAAGVMEGFLDKPLVDWTGLSGRYDFTLTFTPDASQAILLGVPPPAADNPDAAPDMVTAFQRQLGLKLESAKTPIDVMVIDKVEKPSAN